MDQKLPMDIQLSVTRALEGEVYPNIIAVAVSYSKDKKLTIRYYLDREPTEYDDESIELVMSEVLADFWQEIMSTEEECIYTTSPLQDLDSLDGFVYAKKDY